MWRSGSSTTAASTEPSSNCFSCSSTSGLVEEAQVPFGEIIELHGRLALVARELGRAELAAGELRLHVEELVLLVAAVLADVRRVERAHLRVAAEVEDHVELRDDRRRA